MATIQEHINKLERQLNNTDEPTDETWRTLQTFSDLSNTIMAFTNEGNNNELHRVR